MNLELTLIGTNNDDLQPVLDAFKDRHKIEMRLRNLEWDTAWSDLVKIAIFSDGAHVSEIGSTWTDSLVGMNSLRQFSPHECQAFGGPAAFVPALWSSCAMTTKPTNIYAIPFISDPYVIVYRRDLLRKAGVDERIAFSRDDAMYETLKLLADWAESPFVIPTRNTLTNIHFIAAWIWGNGGDFLSAQGDRAIFDQPKALDGARRFFELSRFMSPSARSLSPTESMRAFVEGHAAVTILGPGMIVDLQADPEFHALLPMIGTAKLPGTPFIGGSNLVIWKHVPYTLEKAALKLVEFLTSHQIQLTYHQKTGMLPARNESLEQTATTPLERAMIESTHNGRAFASMPLWGLVEERLNTAYKNIWQSVFAADNPAIDTILKEHLIPLAKHLNLTLNRSGA